MEVILHAIEKYGLDNAICERGMDGRFYLVDPDGSVSRKLEEMGQTLSDGGE
tara:strand:- start:595 stop:750 length:156 start_codon:yes stop_codon:yes gene_type:complete